MSWFHERTDDGWVVLDENRAIVAIVPDAAHEREDDAVQIALAANGSVYYGVLRRSVQALADRLNQDVESRRRVVRTLVEQLGKDLRVMDAQLAERGADHVLTAWLAGHVRELVEAQADLDVKRREHAAVVKVLEGDE